MYEQAGKRLPSDVKRETVKIKLESPILTLLDTEVTSLGRHGNALHITVPRHVAKTLSLHEGEDFYMLSGNSLDTLLQTVDELKKIKRETWILLVRRGELG